MVDFGDLNRELPFNGKLHNKDDEKPSPKDFNLKEKIKGDEKSSLIIEKPLSNITRDSGDTVRMKCEFNGNPTPEIQWYKNEAPLEPERGKLDIRKYTAGVGKIGSRLKIVDVDIHDTGYYKCEASNEGHTVETTGILMVKAGRMKSPSIISNFPPSFPHFPALGGRLPDFETMSNDIGFCQFYRGVACSQIIGNKTIYVKATMTLSQMEEKLTAILTILSTGKEMTPECRKYAVPFFCYAIFPPCDETLPYPVPRHVCREDCDVLETSTCKFEMASARKHSLLSNQDLVPECEELPDSVKPQMDVQQGHFTLSKDPQANCISLSVPRVVQVDHDATCYESRGEGYRGPVSHTLSSHQCQTWNPVEEYEELSGGHNYCRNPGGLEPQPWCFISDPHMRREICDIPKCPDYAWLYIFLPSLFGAIILGILVGIWCKRQRRKTCTSKLSPHSTTAQLIPIHHGTNHSQQIEMQKFLPRVPMGIHEVSHQAIHFLHELGDGVYGKVFRGEMHHPRSANGTLVQPVAIKTLKENSTHQTRQEFYKEMETMANLQHPNVVCLVAVCMREEPLCMLFEYMFQCDLHEFLLVHSPHSDVSARSDDGTPQILELSDFLAIAMQIASGMDFLSNKRYVHRDLAARNCLVSVETTPTSLSQTCLSNGLITAPLMDNILVKISDLGVSRNSCAKEYFRIRNTLLPVRWMAPESLLYGTFTAESDVWSYGILLWEIFSYGIRPYFNCDNPDVIELICGHQLLPRPEYCPPYVYAVMNDCWHDTPSHRPNFKEIYNRLCSVQTMHERTFSISHSVLTHNSSHPSSTGPSNKTLSTNLSCGTGNIIVNGAPGRQNGFNFCGTGGGFLTAKMIPSHRTHQCEQV